MQKHILTLSFLLVLTLLFFYPKPSNLFEQDHLIMETLKSEKTKYKNSKVIEYLVFSKDEQQDNNEEVLIPHQPMP